MYFKYDHESKDYLKIPYTSCILRYHHDAVTGEFINVGVVVYEESGRYLRAKCTRSIWRALHFFTGTGPSSTFPVKGIGESVIKVDIFLRAVKCAEDRINKMGQALTDGLPMVWPDAGLDEILDGLLRPADTGIRFSPITSGLSLDPGKILGGIYERRVAYYESEPDATIVRSPVHGGKPAYSYIRYYYGEQEEAAPPPAHEKFKIEGSTLAELLDRRDELVRKAIFSGSTGVATSDLLKEIEAINEGIGRRAWVSQEPAKDPEDQPE